MTKVQNVPGPEFDAIDVEPDFTGREGSDGAESASRERERVVVRRGVTRMRISREEDFRFPGGDESEFDRPEIGGVPVDGEGHGRVEAVLGFRER